MKKETILYIRLSVEDDDLGVEKKESGSVQNQREYLYQFLENHPELQTGTICELVDDGYSGTNFERPAMQELIQRIKMGRVQTVIVKDLSRLGRNYIEVGKCLEEIFPRYGVRFLSVNDHYDSAQVSLPGMDVVFQNIIYDYYSKELSAKVIQAKTSLAQKGMFLGGIPPFGYIRNPENHQLQVDPKAAETVRDIFELCLEGKNYSEIARMLNQRGVECPEARLHRLGIRKRTGTSAVYEWKAASVRSVLRNPAVKGTVVNHRVKRKQMGKKQLVSVPVDERIRAEKKHKAIIAPDVFERVQEHLDRKKGQVSVEESIERIYPLAGLMKCAICGANLVPEGRKTKYYVCLAARTSADKGHKTISIAEDLVIESLLQILLTKRRLEEHLEKNLHKDMTEKSDPDKPPEIKERGAKGRYYLGHLYDRYADGEISREEFLEQKKMLWHEKEDREKADSRNAGDGIWGAEDIETAWKQREYEILKKIFQENVEAVWVKGDGQVDIRWKNIL